MARPLSVSMDETRLHHPISVDLTELYETVVRSMAFKGKEAEHKAAVKRVGEVLYEAFDSYQRAISGE